MAMAAAMAMSASAVDPAQIVPDADGQPTPETAGAEVTYNVDPGYTVTIPAGADISSGSDEQSITANNVLLEQGQKITVTLFEASNTASGKSFTAKDESGESTVKYTIKAGTADVAVGDTVAEFETKTGEQSATLTFTKDEDSTPTFAGKHTETLTFNIAVESAAPAVLGGTWDYATISAINDNSVFTKDGVTLTTTSRSKSAGNFYDYGTNTFSVSSGKITKIEMISTYANLTAFPGATVVVDGKFYSTQDEREKDCYKVTWTGNASEVAFRADIYAVEQITITVE